MKRQVTHRQWGKFEILAKGKNYRVKKLTFKPEGQTSLQYHNHRSERWVVIKGKGVVYDGKQCTNLINDWHVYVAKGHLHQIISSKEDPLIIIEVWHGDKMLETDITRLTNKTKHGVRK